MPTNKFTFSNTFIGWQKQLGIALLYLLSGYVINHNFTNYNIVCTFWPGTGLALASLLIGGKRYIWGVFFGSLLLNIQSNESLWAAGGITLTHILEALCGLWLLTGNTRPVLLLLTLRDYLLLIALGGSAASLVGAIIGAVVLLLAGYITTADYFKNVLHWWMGDTLGVVLITPLMLAWGRGKPDKINAKQLLEGLSLTGMTLLAGQIVFLDWFHEYLSDTPKAYWMFLCVTWAGVRMGNRGVTLVILLIAIQALFGAYYKVGYFADEISRANLYNYWAYMLILSVVGMTVTTYVNEIKRALLRLQLKNSALNAAANGIVITDVGGRIEWANQAFSRLTGFGLNDVYDLNPSELVNSGNPDEDYYLSMRLTIFANKVWHGELVNCRKDGSLYDEEMTITPLTNEQGEITHFVAVKQDITERKQMEEAREEALSRLQKIASRVPGAVYQYRLHPDGSACFPFASEAIRDIYRVSPEEVREDASKVLAVFHPDDYDGINASIQKSAQNLTPWCYEYRVKFDDAWCTGCSATRYRRGKRTVPHSGTASSPTSPCANRWKQNCATVMSLMPAYLTH